MGAALSSRKVRGLMGVYWECACHNCGVVFVPELLKLREIALNESIAANLGRFMVDHAGHTLQMVNDGDRTCDAVGHYERLRPPHVFNKRTEITTHGQEATQSLAQPAGLPEEPQG